MHDDTTKRGAKGKSHVESLTRYRNLSAEFEDFSDNSINEVNAAELEDITYSNDEDDVGAEADFNNLETSITVSPIPTTRVHKDHPVPQIISDLSSAIQTRSMTKVAKDQGGLSQMFNYDFHTYVKSDFLYGTIEEEVYVCQPPGFKDPDYSNMVYKVVKALYVLHQAPRAWQKGDILLVQIYVYDIIFGSTNKDLCKAFEKLMKDKFQMSSMGELTFFLDTKSTSTLIDTEKPLLKDPNDNDYAGPSLDRKSTTRGCQFLRCRLISWQCKKKIVVATSSTKAEYVAAASCCAQHPKVSLTQPSSNELFQAPHNPPCLEHLVNGLNHGRCSVLITFSPDCLWQILHPNPFQTIIKISVNIVEHLIAEFVKQYMLPFASDGPIRIWLSKVEPLLVAFDSQLKIFHTSLDDDASCNHPKRDVKGETFLNGQIRQLSLNKK
nr:hypothetical protein [Tanacetum cinerariifolium]